MNRIFTRYGVAITISAYLALGSPAHAQDNGGTGPELRETTHEGMQWDRLPDGSLDNLSSANQGNWMRVYIPPGLKWYTPEFWDGVQALLEKQNRDIPDTLGIDYVWHVRMAELQEYRGNLKEALAEYGEAKKICKRLHVYYSNEVDTFDIPRIKRRLASVEDAAASERGKKQEAEDRASLPFRRRLVNLSLFLVAPLLIVGMMELMGVMARYFDWDTRVDFFDPKWRWPVYGAAAGVYVGFILTVKVVMPNTGPSMTGFLMMLGLTAGCGLSACLLGKVIGRV